MSRYFDDYYSLDSSSLELEHHGILGMRWGIRHYQNPDGSLTPLGRERYYKKQMKATEKAADKMLKKGGRRTESSMTEKTLPKGTVLYRVTGPNEDLPKHNVYVTYTKADRKIVRGISPFLMENRNLPTSSAEEKTLVAEKDIKIAPINVQRDAQKEVLMKHGMIEDLATKMAKLDLNNNDYLGDIPVNTIHDYATGKLDGDLLKNRAEKLAMIELSSYPSYKSWDSEKKKKAVMDTAIQYDKRIRSVGDYYKETYKDFEKSLDSFKNKPFIDDDNDPLIKSGKIIVDWEFGEGGKYQKEVALAVQKKGYNALYDNAMIAAGVNRTQEAYEPLIILDGTAVSVKSNKKLSTKELAEGTASYYQYRSKNWLAS